MTLGSNTILRISIWLLVASATLIRAMPAYPNSFVAKQPDGREIQLRIHGDELFHYTTDLNGFTVMEDKTTGWFRYAQHKDKTMRDLESSLLTVGQHDPATYGLQRHIIPVKNEHRQRSQARKHTVSTNVEGELRTLVVTMIFSDHVDRVLPSIADLEILMNSDTPNDLCPTGSVRASLRTSSYGKLTLKSSVAPYVVLPETEAYYAGTSIPLSFSSSSLS